MYQSERVNYSLFVKSTSVYNLKIVATCFSFNNLDCCILKGISLYSWWELCRGLGTRLLGIPPDGYLLWIRAKLQPRLECVCWTAHCISGDHTGSISKSKSLCCPLSLSEHVPLGSGSQVQYQWGTCAETCTCCWVNNYPSSSFATMLEL